MGAYEHITGTYDVHGGKAVLVKGCASGDATPDEIVTLHRRLRTSIAEIRTTLRDENIRRTKADLRASVTPDQLIIQAVTNIEELDKVANRLAKRLRDWTALSHPELAHDIQDHRAFADALLAHPRRPTDGMGASIPDEAFGAIAAQAQLITQVYAQRDFLLEHLEVSMRTHTPNLLAVAGGMIGAKLLAHAGSLKRLAMLPAGTIQLLGAETALFRHLRNRSVKPPKHGIIFNHVLLQRTQKKGRMARVLADCIAIAARVDYFKGAFVGDDLRKKAEAAV